MQFIEDETKVRELRNLFYKNELKLAGALVDVFNDDARLRKTLNDIVSEGMGQLSTYTGFEMALLKACNEEAFLALWDHMDFGGKIAELKNIKSEKRLGGARFLAFRKQVQDRAKNGRLRAEHCSDVIRLMGAVIEKGAELPLREDDSRQWAEELGRKDGYRAPVPLPPNRGGKTAGHAMAWGQKGAPKCKCGTTVADQNARRDRSGRIIGWLCQRCYNLVPVPKGMAYGADKNGPGHGRYRGNVEDKKGKMASFQDLMKSARFRGMAVKEASTNKDMKSIVGRMERMFGYPIMGADISGTTADSAYFVQRFGASIAMIPAMACQKALVEGKLDPIFHLLPVATIVAFGHHHLLETALTLTLKKIVDDYKVGMYGTLRPNEWGKTGHAAAKQQIEGILNRATPQAPRILVYYEGGAVKGCVKFSPRDPLDTADWGKVASVLGGESLQQIFVGVGDYPTLKDISDLLSRRRCSLKAQQDVKKQQG